MTDGPRPLFSCCVACLMLAALFTMTSCGTVEDEADKSNRLSDLKICMQPDGETCESNEAELRAAVEKIYASAIVTNPLDGTEAHAILTRIDGGDREMVLSYSVGIEPEEDAEKAVLNFFFTTEGDWEPGQYEVEVVVHAVGSEAQRQTFEVMRGSVAP